VQLRDDGNVHAVPGRFDGGTHAGQASTDHHHVVSHHPTPPDPRGSLGKQTTNRLEPLRCQQTGKSASATGVTNMSQAAGNVNSFG